MSNLTIEQVERYRKGCEEPTYWWAPNRSESKALCDLALAALRQPLGEHHYEEQPDGTITPVEPPADVAGLIERCENAIDESECVTWDSDVRRIVEELENALRAAADAISALAVRVAELENPPPLPKCGIDGCTNEANCGTPTKAGPYVRCCGEHWAKIQEEELK